MSHLSSAAVHTCDAGTALMLRIAELVPKHPNRSKPAQQRLQQDKDSPALATAGASSSTSGNKAKGKDKKKGKR